MKRNVSVKSKGFAASTERRNFRRAVYALSLIALAAMGRAARADDGADAAGSLFHAPTVQTAASSTDFTA